MRRVKSRGKMAVLCAAAGVLLASAAAIDPLQAYFRERYWAERLRTTTGEEQEEAAKRLAELKPVRTARGLIEDIRKNEGEVIMHGGTFISDTIIVPSFHFAGDTRRATANAYSLRLLRMATAQDGKDTHAVERAIEAAIADEQATDRPDPRFCSVLAEILDKTGPPVVPNPHKDPASHSYPVELRNRVQ